MGRESCDEFGDCFHPAPSPFGILYRCMYSKNIANLMFAGRNISCTHAAASSCRVMSTCAVIDAGDGYQPLCTVTDNYLRLWKYTVEVKAKRVRLIPKASWGADTAHIYAAILK